MTLGEFKAFIEGMDIKDAPTKEQWGRISEKLATVTPDIQREFLPSISPAPQIGTWNPEVTCTTLAAV